MEKNILPKGFLSAGLSAGIKPDESLDMALIMSENTMQLLLASLQLTKCMQRQLSYVKSI